MKLVQLTDIHLVSPGELSGGRDPNINLDRALEHVVRYHSDAEAIVVTGDLSDRGERADYERLRDRLRDVPLPVELMVGNHDSRETLARVFPNLAGEGGFVQRVVPLSMGHAVLLDTFEPGTDAGGLCEARLGWLSRQLETLPGPVWLFMHHHPVPLGLPPMDRIMLRSPERFADVIRPHRTKIAHLFHGHCHLPLSGSFLGIPFSAPRGTNQANWPDFGEERLYASAELPEAYSVIIANHDSTMIHMVEFGYTGDVRRSP